jgi:hypothetical protein
MISAFGVDHGDETVSKADKKFNRTEKVSGVLNAGLAPVGSVYGATKAKDGKKAKVGLKSLGRGVAEGAAGSAIGGGAAALATRGRSAAATSFGSTLGGGVGAGHGTMASMRNSRKLGYMKKGNR